MSMSVGHNTIERIELLQVDLPPKVARTDAIQSFVTQETPIVRIFCGDGAVGTGYSYTIGTGGSSVMALLRDHLAPRLIGRDSTRDRGDLEGPLLRHACDGGRGDHEHRARGDRYRAVGPAVPARRIAAVEDGRRGATARAGVHDRGRLAAPSPGSRSSTNRWRPASRDSAAPRSKVGKPSIAEDVRRLAAVREATGDDFALMVDANQAFTVAEACRRAHAYRDLGLGWLEEPLPAEDLGGHVELAAKASMPIAVGESLYHPSHFREYLERRACSVVQVDVGRIGGITPWLKVAHLAEAFNAPVCPHFLMEIHVSLAAAVPNGAWVEYIPQLDDVTTSRMAIEEGHAVPPDTPGLGIAWDFAALSRYTVARHTVAS